MQTANALEGSAIGAEFLSFFGGVWFLFALAACGALDAVKAALVLLCVLAFFSLAEWVKRAARRFPLVPDDPAASNRFFWINAAQWGTMFVLYQLLHWLGREVYFVTAVAVVVGLHFFWLARPLQNPSARGTGTMLLLWAVSTVAFAPVEHLQSITAGGAGLILWQAAATALATTIAAVRQPLPEPAPCSPAPAA
ncbi:MAG: hypothetical protein P4L03_07540 [Terracidiphilus sp.]|nr:hypothetical protein [Terracidiphilus sp.]